MHDGEIEWQRPQASVYQHFEGAWGASTYGGRFKSEFRSTAEAAELDAQLLATEAAARVLQRRAEMAEAERTRCQEAIAGLVAAADEIRGFYGIEEDEGYHKAVDELQYAADSARELVPEDA